MKMINDIEKFVNSLNDTVEHCDMRSRKKFLYLTFKLLKNKINVPSDIKLELYDENLYPTYNGFFRVEFESEKILFNDKYIQTDKSSEECTDLVTKTIEMDNDWLYPIKILDCLCHELKHCFDYYNDSLLVIDKSKTKGLDKDTYKDVYMINPSEISAFKFSYACIKQILNEVRDYISSSQYDYLILEYELEKKMIPWVKDIEKQHKERVELAKYRLTNSGLNYKDFVYEMSKNTNKNPDLTICD